MKIWGLKMVQVDHFFAGFPNFDLVLVFFEKIGEKVVDLDYFRTLYLHNEKQQRQTVNAIRSAIVEICLAVKKILGPKIF